jgi:hypothetical protein
MSMRDLVGRLSGRLRWLAGFSVLGWLGLRAALVLPGLAALPAAGCLCDCAGEFNLIVVSSEVRMTSLAVSGDACGEVSCSIYPHDAPDTCLSFKVRMVRAGSCYLMATATDGRIASVDVTTIQRKEDCCGKIYTIGKDELGESDNVRISF